MYDENIDNMKFIDISKITKGNIRNTEYIILQIDALEECQGEESLECLICQMAKMFYM